MKYLLISLLLGITFFGNAQVKVIDNFEDFEQNYIKDCSEDSIYVINFWATWCAPCVKELPHFQEIDSSSVEGMPVKLTLVSLDFSSMLDSRLIPFLEKRKIKNEVVLLADEDTNQWINKIDEEWSGAIPATLIIYKNEKYFFRKTYESKEEIEEEIKKLIKK